MSSSVRGWHLQLAYEQKELLQIKMPLPPPYIDRSLIMIAAITLISLLGVLIAGGIWISFTLGIVAWVGVAFFSSTKPEFNLFTSYWNTYSSMTLASLPMFIWMGEILYRTRLAEQMFAGLAPWLDKLPGRLLHVNVITIINDINNIGFLNDGTRWSTNTPTLTISPRLNVAGNARKPAAAQNHATNSPAPVT